MPRVESERQEAIWDFTIFFKLSEAEFPPPTTPASYGMDIKTASSRLLYRQDLGNAGCQKKARIDPVLAPGETICKPFSALFLPLKWYTGIRIHFSRPGLTFLPPYLSFTFAFLSCGKWGCMGSPHFPVGSPESWQEIKYYGAEKDGPRVIQTCSCSCGVLEKWLKFFVPLCL